MENNTHTWDDFEFSTNLNSNNNNNKDLNFDQEQSIIFCGKVLISNNNNTKKQMQIIDDVNINKPFGFDDQHDHDPTRRSFSFHFNTSKLPLPLRPQQPATRSFRCTSSNSSRKHKVLIGLARMPPSMDLQDIKRRQSLRTPTRIPPPPPSNSDDNNPVNVSSKGNWGMLRALRSRSYLASALSKAYFACIPSMRSKT